jgi:hypothetical protein
MRVTSARFGFGYAALCFFEVKMPAFLCGFVSLFRRILATLRLYGLHPG